MKLFLQCAKCLEIYLQESLDTLDFPNISKVTLNESSIYSTGCDIHDEQDVYCTTPKFEMIFQNGFSSIIDGYYRESVNSFASSLELFYEYYVRVLSVHLNKSSEKHSKAWRELANSSERQLGAYTMSYFLAHDEPPP